MIDQQMTKISATINFLDNFITRCSPLIDFTNKESIITLESESYCDWHHKYNDRSDIIHRCKGVAVGVSLYKIMKDFLSKLIESSIDSGKDNVLRKKTILCSPEYIDSIDNNIQYISIDFLNRDFENLIIGFDYNDIAIREEYFEVTRNDNKINCRTKYFLQIKSNIYKALV